MSDEIAKRCQDAYNFLASVAGFEPEEYDAFQVDRYHNGIIAIVPGKPKHYHEASAVFRAAVKKIFAECAQEQEQARQCKMATHIDLDGFWDEVALANLDAKEAKIAELKELINKFIAEALR